MTLEQLQSLMHYVEFGAAEAAALRRFLAFAEPHFEAIVTDFYEAIEAHPDAAAAITGGKEQVARLKLTLKKWMHDVLAGPHDRAYLESHSRIGRVHVRIALPQEFMFSAMNRIRGRFLELVPPDELAMTRAINRILDIELAIMLDTYREDLLDKMRTAERLATLGQFAATIAHELRNPLGTIESSLFLMRRRLDQLGLQDETIGRHSARIGQQVHDCGATITGLLDMARDRPLRRSRFGVRALLDAAVAAAGVADGVDVEVSIPLEFDLDGDAEQLRSALANLIRNSIEAPGTSSVRVSAECIDRTIQFDVSDDGPGIPPDLQVRVFDVLFTTKASGTGLGLTFAERVFEAHGGALELMPTLRGAHFRATMSRSDAG